LLGGLGTVHSHRCTTAEDPGIEIRSKHKLAAPMHLKSYQIDSKLLHTGIANFSASGLNRDNDLIESAEAAEGLSRLKRDRVVNVSIKRSVHSVRRLNVHPK
jgi:hypothetical protein